MTVSDIFADAQASAAGHRGLAKRLRRLEENHSDFKPDLIQCVYRLLDVKKSEPAANRCVKFLAAFLPSSNAATAVLSALVPFLSAKEKTVRYRATQIISNVLGTLTSIDDDLYRMIRHELIKRLRDKIPAIRLEAVMALGRLVENEMDEEQDEDRDFDSEDEDMATTLLEKLLDALQNDTNAEVRRALLLNLPITPVTLPYLLERARDRDGPTRRALYTRLLPTLGDFRHLSLSMREKLLRWGLRDRDENVRRAAGRLFRERWIEDCARSRNDVETGEEAGPTKILSPPSIPALLELLERIDVINSGTEAGIAQEAMQDFWAGRTDYLDAVQFDDAFWAELTPESAFVARTFNDFCQQNPEYQSLCEEKMPEVTRLGFYLQKYTNCLLDTIRSTNEAGGGDEETVEQEFMVEQLLHIAQTLDYTDEVGRRKMFSLLREILAMADLPEELTRLTVSALRLVCDTSLAGERDFCSVVLEAIAEVHDTIMSSETEQNGEDDDSFVSARSAVSSSDERSGSLTPRTPGSNSQQPRDRHKPHPSRSKGPSSGEDRAIREIIVNMKCLHIAQCMLQNVSGPLASNHHLETMLNNLVIPAVRSHEAPIRERGLLCLGLCCLLEPALAHENTKLFVHCFQRGNEGLQIMALQILCDILLVSRNNTRAGGGASPSSGTATSAIDISPFLKALRSSQSNSNSHSAAGTPASTPASVQSVATTSLAKLLLCGFYADQPDRFDEAVVRAQESGAVGADILVKVKNAVVVDVPGGPEEGLGSNPEGETQA